MRSLPAKLLVVVATFGLSAVRLLGACVGDDPNLGASSDAGSIANGDANKDDDATPAAPDFTFEPPTIDLDPGESATLKVRGSASISSVTLGIASDPLPDGGGVPAVSVTLGASAVSLSPAGEATVQVQASPSATQHRFTITGTAGSRTHEAKGRVAGKPGDLDIYFGDKGGYFDLAPDGDCTANSVVVQPDGKFVVAGTARGYGALWIARFTSDGQLDTTFGPTKAGYVTLSNARGAQMELMPNGSIAIAALALNDPKLYRVGADGTPDPAWGGIDGIDPKLGGGNFVSGPIGRQGDNVLVGGNLADNTTAVIKRYLPDGGADPSFGSSGNASFVIGPLGGGTSPRVHAIAVEGNETFWVVGQYSNSGGNAPYERTFVQRFKPNGTSDNVDVSGTFQGAATALTIQDGKAVVGAFEYPDGNYSAYAFRVSNTLDGMFGLNGRALITGPPGGFPTSMVTDAQGRIYVANGAYTIYSFDAFRLTESGSRDTSFGPSANGLVRLPTGRAHGLALAGRQLIVVGVNDANDARRARIARYWR